MIENLLLSFSSFGSQSLVPKRRPPRESFPICAIFIHALLVCVDERERGDRFDINFPAPSGGPVGMFQGEKGAVNAAADIFYYTPYIYLPVIHPRRLLSLYLMSPSSSAYQFQLPRSPVSNGQQQQQVGGGPRAMEQHQQQQQQKSSSPHAGNGNRLPMQDNNAGGGGGGGYHPVLMQPPTSGNKPPLVLAKPGEDGVIVDGGDSGVSEAGDVTNEGRNRKRKRRRRKKKAQRGALYDISLHLYGT